MLKVWVDALAFSTISTFEPSVFLKATLGNTVDASEAILTAPGLTNFEAWAII